MKHYSLFMTNKFENLKKWLEMKNGATGRHTFVNRGKRNY